MNKFVATLTWLVESDCDEQPLRLFLREKAQLSRRTLSDIKFNGGLILLNGEEVTVRALVHTGDEVTISLPAEEISNGLQPEEIKLDIVYEDEHLLVINKGAKMATIPSREHPHHTLAHAVLGYYKRKGIPATFHAVNRLDKDTSGLLLVAKHRFAHDRLSKLQQKGRVKRFYEAFVQGELQQEKGVIDAPIARNPSSIIARQVSADGQRALTHFAVKSRRGGYTYVEVQLETGRTHQIRVHFSYLGHPLLGDDLYGGSKSYIERQALHCVRLEFDHPFTNERKMFVQPLPPDMKMLMTDEY